MTMSVANAIIALAQIMNIDSMTSERQKSIVNNLKKIEFVCRKILNGEILKKLILIAKQNPDFEPKATSYSADTADCLHQLQ